MREILFRGKRNDDGGEWHYGGYIHDDSIMEHRGGIFRCVPVLPETVGQYTGLTDKNGKRIFEGDILQFENGDGEFSLYSCEWSSELCGWSIKFHEYDTPADPLDALFCTDAEVIGNIHDNPELLEVSGND